MAQEPKSNSKKRRVRNPETFRERALKSNQEVQRASTMRNNPFTFLGKIVRPVVSPIGRGIKKFFSLPGIRLLRYPARLIGKILFISYFVDSWKELKLVTWPGWRESRRLTYAVLVFAVIFGGAVAGVDWGLGKLFRNLLLK